MRPAAVIFLVATACLLLVWFGRPAPSPSAVAQEFVTVRQLQEELDALVEVLCVELKWQDIHRQILDIEVRALHGLAPDGGAVPEMPEDHVIAIGSAINSISEQPYLSRLDCEQR